MNFDCRELLYQEFSIYMTWNHDHCRWNRWKINFNKIIKWIYFIDFNDNKRFYLYILFIIIKNSISFEDLYIYNNIVHQNFKSICIAHDLLDFDEQWNHSLMKIELWQDEYQLHQLFICILLYCYLINAFQLWLKHTQHLSNDYCYQL